MQHTEYIQTMTMEYERICTEIRLIEAANVKIVGFALTILSSGLAYGIHHKLNEVLFFVPVALSGVIFYAILQYHNMMWFGGYKKYLEQRISETLGDIAFGWEHVVEKRPRVNVINISLIGTYLLVGAGIVIYCLVKIVHNYDEIVYIPYSVLVVALFSLVLVSLRYMAKAFGNSYLATEIVFQEQVNLPET